MTYILGAKCSDGVVLVADTKVTIGEGTEHSYSKKIFKPFTQVYMGAAGMGGLYKSFENRVVSVVNTYNQLQDKDPKYQLNSSQSFSVLVENVIREMHSVYGDDRNLILQQFDALMAQRITNDAELSHITPIGFMEPIDTIKVIGHGEPYGAFFLKKKIWRPDFTMQDTAKLAIFIINHIQNQKLDNSVGFDEEYLPQVCYVPNIPKDIQIDESTSQKFSIKEAEQREVNAMLGEIKELDKPVTTLVEDFNSFFRKNFLK